jgi:hypothetical protein
MDGETDGASFDDSQTGFRRGSDRDLKVERQTLWRVDSVGLLQSLSRKHLWAGFRRDSFGAFRSPSRGAGQDYGTRRRKRRLPTLRTAGHVTLFLVLLYLDDG